MQTPFRITPTVFHVLFALSDGELHAYGVMKAVEGATDGRTRIAPGSLHFTLGKLLDAGLVEESDDRPDPEVDDARRKYFRLTEAGRVVLTEEARAMAHLVAQARERKLIPQEGAG